MQAFAPTSQSACSATPYRLTSDSDRKALARLPCLRVGLVRFAVTDDAANRGAELAVSRHVAGGFPDDGTLDAAFRLRTLHRSDREHRHACRRNRPSHDRRPCSEMSEPIRSLSSRSGRLRIRAPCSFRIQAGETGTRTSFVFLVAGRAVHSDGSFELSVA